MPAKGKGSKKDVTMTAAKVAKTKSPAKGGKGGKGKGSNPPKKKRSSRLHFKSYIFKVLRQVHPDNSISKRTTNTVDSMIHSVLEKLVTEIREMMAIRGSRRTLSKDYVKTAIRLALPGELSKHALAEMTKAVTKFEVEDAKPPKKDSKGKTVPKSSSTKAGLQFPVGRIRSFLRDTYGFNLISRHGSVAIAAVLEYICAEVLELSGNAARDNGKVVVMSRHVFLGVANDEELKKLFLAGGSVIAKGGVMPNIHAVLLPPKKDKEGQASASKKASSKKAPQKRTSGKHRSRKKPASNHQGSKKK